MRGGRLQQGALQLMRVWPCELCGDLNGSAANCGHGSGASDIVLASLSTEPRLWACEHLCSHLPRHMIKCGTTEQFGVEDLRAAGCD